jgi:hypothetical protein
MTLWLASRLSDSFAAALPRRSWGDPKIKSEFEIYIIPLISDSESPQLHDYRSTNINDVICDGFSYPFLLSLWKSVCRYVDSETRKRETACEKAVYLTIKEGKSCWNIGSHKPMLTISYEGNALNIWTLVLTLTLSKILFEGHKLLLLLICIISLLTLREAPLSWSRG